MQFPAAVLLSFVLIAPVFAQNENAPTADYSVAADIQYCTGGGQPLLMDIFIPRHLVKSPAPAILWIHGGGWERGDKNGSSGARFLASAGFITASLYHRLSGDAKFPAAVEDTKCAIRYLRANASKYGIDPDRIGVAGASSGGHLALMIGATTEAAGLEGSGGWSEVSSAVRAVSSYYGPTDFTDVREEYGGRGLAAVIKMVGVTPEADPARFRRASPISYVTHKMPPVLLVHGDGDQLVPFHQSEKMLAALEKAGVTARLVRVGNADHDFEPRDKSKPLSISVDEIHEITIAFFRKWLDN